MADEDAQCVAQTSEEPEGKLKRAVAGGDSSQRAGLPASTGEQDLREHHLQRRDPSMLLQPQPWREITDVGATSES